MASDLKYRIVAVLDRVRSGRALYIGRIAWRTRERVPTIRKALEGMKELCRLNLKTDDVSLTKFGKKVARSLRPESKAR